MFHVEQSIMKELSIYIHIPYCRRACTYCDFYFSTQLNSQPQFIEALLKEIELTSKDWAIIDNQKLSLATIYLGGGTPSVLSGVQIGLILNQLNKYYPLNDDIEITLEANPNDLSYSILKEWKDLGINRLSIGIQSFLERELSWMNRNHNAKQALEALPLAQDAGFNNISIDLIYATPTLSDLEWKQTLKTAFELKPQHLSAYGLTVESKTKLAHDILKGKVQPADEETFERHFRILQEEISNNSFLPYEISNYALPNFTSKHNSNYWKQKPYLGLGPSAHSYNSIKRFSNEPNIHGYINRLLESRIEYSFEETLSPTDKINEYIMTQLRRMEGIELKSFHQLFGINLQDYRKVELDKMYHNGYLMTNPSNTDAISLTIDGKLCADRLASQLMFEPEELV